jgi:hypothetical protein
MKFVVQRPTFCLQHHPWHLIAFHCINFQGYDGLGPSGATKQ